MADVPRIGSVPPVAWEERDPSVPAKL